MNKARSHARSGAVAGLSLFAFLSGCASDKVTGPGALRETWSTQLEQYGIFAVFPPRADIQVGDIYLTCGSTIAQKDSTDPAMKAARRLVPNAAWIASVSGMLDDAQGHDGYLSAEYRNRVQLPRIPIPTDAGKDASAAETASAPANASAPVAASAPKTGKSAKTLHGAHGRDAAAVSPASAVAAQPTAVFGSRSLATMMPVSFPEFFSASGTKADAAAIVPLPTILANLGVNASAVDSVQISVPSAESYGLPAATMMSALAQWTENNNAPGGTVSNIQQIVAPLRTTEGSTAYCPMGEPQFFIVTEIYATRSIDVSMSFSNSAGLGGGVGLNLSTRSKNAAVWDALSKYLTAPQSSASGVSGSGSSGASNSQNDKVGTSQTSGGTPNIDQATAFVKELNALYSKLGGDQTLSYPGGQVAVVTANSAGISMSRKFEVPVVIGYRGMALSLNAFDRHANPAPIAAHNGTQTSTPSGPVPNPISVPAAPAASETTVKRRRQLHSW